MCEGCGCHADQPKTKHSARRTGIAPGCWHVHADGTAHSHAHPHPYQPAAKPQAASTAPGIVDHASPAEE